MKKIELEIVALSHSITQTHSYAVVLGEVNGLRRLPIVIGGFEAQCATLFGLPVSFGFSISFVIRAESFSFCLAQVGYDSHSFVLLIRYPRS